MSLLGFTSTKLGLAERHSYEKKKPRKDTPIKKKKKKKRPRGSSAARTYGPLKIHFIFQLREYPCNITHDIYFLI